MPQSEIKNRTKFFDPKITSKKIAGVVNTYSEEDLFSRIVDKENYENGYNLNIIRYVRTDPPPPK